MAGGQDITRHSICLPATLKWFLSTTQQSCNKDQLKGKIIVGKSSKLVSQMRMARFTFTDEGDVT
jgi:hypothetical protein